MLFSQLLSFVLCCARAEKLCPKPRESSISLGFCVGLRLEETGRGISEVSHDRTIPEQATALLRRTEAALPVVLCVVLTSQPLRTSLPSPGWCLGCSREKAAWEQTGASHDPAEWVSKAHSGGQGGTGSGRVEWAAGGVVGPCRLSAGFGCCSIARTPDKRPSS